MTETFETLLDAVLANMEQAKSIKTKLYASHYILKQLLISGLVYLTICQPSTMQSGWISCQPQSM